MLDNKYAEQIIETLDDSEGFDDWWNGLHSEEQKLILLSLSNKLDEFKRIWQ